MGKIAATEVKDWREIAYLGDGNPNWRGGLHCVCTACRKEFHSTGTGRQVKFCPECRPLALSGERNPNWAGRVPVICPCDTKFFVTPHQKELGRTFCSTPCSNIFRNQSNKKSGTNIEIIIQRWLEKKGIPFESQVVIPKVGIVDFLAGTTVLECDGEYWHTLPKRAQYDARRDRKLNKLGYPVIRLNSTEIEQGNLDEIIRIKAMIATFHGQWRQSWQ